MPGISSALLPLSLSSSCFCAGCVCVGNFTPGALKETRICSLWGKGLKDFLEPAFSFSTSRQDTPDTERYCTEQALWGTGALVQWQSTLPKAILPPKFITCAAAQWDKLISAFCLTNLVQRPTKQMYV